MFLRFATVLLLLCNGLSQAQRAPIVFATTASNYREGLLKIESQYERLHPDVDVRIQFQPGEAYATWLLTQVTSGDGPDIINGNYASGFYERGLLLSFTQHLQQENPYTKKKWIETLDRQFIEKYKQGSDAIQIPIDFLEIGFFYNKTIYDKLGLKPPRTWEEMIEQAKAVRKAGYIPFAVPGDADSYWAGVTGWVFRFVTDAYTRDLVPMTLSQPGDWDFEPRLNGNFKLDLTDAYNDAYVLFNQERMLGAIADHRISVKDSRFREAYNLIKEFSDYWERGFNGTSPTSTYQLFMTQRAAVMIAMSTNITSLDKDVAELKPQDRFEWSIFPIPPVTNSPRKIPPFRGVGGGGTILSVLKKDDAQSSRVVDFLMYLTHPESAQILVDEAVKARQQLLGPMLIPGVKLPEFMERRFAPFRNRGFEKLSFRGVANMDDQEAVWKWTVWAQRFLDGRVSLDECLEKYQEVVDEAVPRIKAVRGFDMDPTTKDTR